LLSKKLFSLVLVSYRYWWVCFSAWAIFVWSLRA